MTGEGERFDRLLEEVIAELPEHIRRRLEEMPIVVDERPSRSLLRRLGVGRGTILCGLYTGIPLTRRSVRHSGVLPDRVQIFRRPIVQAARQRGRLTDRQLKQQIRRTVLHEIGHHFGMSEEELRDLGYD